MGFFDIFKSKPKERPKRTYLPDPPKVGLTWKEIEAMPPKKVKEYQKKWDAYNKAHPGPTKEEIEKKEATIREMDKRLYADYNPNAGQEAKRREEATRRQRQMADDLSYLSWSDFFK